MHTWGISIWAALGLVTTILACSSAPGGARGNGNTAGSSTGGSPGSGGAYTSDAGAMGGNVGVAGGGNADACTGPLTFADPDVEVTVRDLIGLPSGPIRREDISGLISLERLLFADVPTCAPFGCGHPNPPIRDHWITSLAGVECLTSVEQINLDSWSVPDFAGLAALPHLSHLDLGLAPDLSLLPALPQLASLSAVLTISNLARLASFTGLTTLELRGTDLSVPGTLDGLAGLTKLQNVLISGRVTNIGFLAGLNDLITVDLRDNDITNLDPLVANAGLGAGDTVDLSGNPINCVSQAQQIIALRARGVNLVSNCP